MGSQSPRVSRVTKRWPRCGKRGLVGRSVRTTVVEAAGILGGDSAVSLFGACCVHTSNHGSLVKGLVPWVGLCGLVPPGFSVPKDPRRLSRGSITALSEALVRKRLASLIFR